MKPKEQQPNHHSPLSRRDVVRGLVGGLIAAGVGAAVFLTNKHGDNNPRPAETRIASAPPTPTPDNSSAQAPQEEARLWQTGYQHSPNKVEITETTALQGRDRVIETLQRMKDSKNRFFSQAFKRYNDLSEQREASIELSPNLDNENTTKEKSIIMLTEAKVKDNKVHFFIRISLEGILNGSNALEFAAGFAHEMEHVKNIEKRMQEIALERPDISAEELIRIAAERSSIPVEIIREEARAYAVQSQSLIEAWQLGYRGQIRVDMYNLSQVFIQYGQSANDPRWKNYIARYFDYPEGDY